MRVEWVWIYPGLHFQPLYLSPAACWSELQILCLIRILSLGASPIDSCAAPDAFADVSYAYSAEHCNNPEERFIRVLQYYLAGWHIKPKGVKKPYNPVLGEFFRCRYEYADGSHGYYIAEQVSHHPPISAFFYISPANKVSILGELRPKSKFLGNSVSTQMEGENRVRLLDKPEDGGWLKFVVCIDLSY